jgi:hypothetical protein
LKDFDRLLKNGDYPLLSSCLGQDQVGRAGVCEAP